MIAHSTFGHESHPIVLQVPSQKFPRNNSGFNHKGWVEDSMSRSDSVYPFQVSLLQVTPGPVREILGVTHHRAKFSLVQTVTAVDLGCGLSYPMCEHIECVSGANGVNPIKHTHVYLKQQIHR